MDWTAKTNNKQLQANVIKFDEIYIYLGKGKFRGFFYDG